MSLRLSVDKRGLYVYYMKRRDTVLHQYTTSRCNIEGPPSHFLQDNKTPPAVALVVNNPLVGRLHVNHPVVVQTY